MEQTLLKVKHLEKFVEKHGEDAFVSQTISKMLAYKVQKYDKQIERLNRELRKFERTYKKKSHVFFEEFKAGRLGDEINFVEWSSLYQIHNRLLEKKKELEGIMQMVEKYIVGIIQDLSVSSAVSSFNVLRVEVGDEQGYVRIKCKL